MASQFPVQDFISKHFPWTVVFYARKHYGFSLFWLARQWIESKPGGDEWLWGDTKTKTDDFFGRVIDRDSEENRVQYQCVNGCCVVIWHTKKNYNTGGGGRPGCSCEDMDDPRDLVRGPLSA